MGDDVDTIDGQEEDADDEADYNEESEDNLEQKQYDVDTIDGQQENAEATLYQEEQPNPWAHVESGNTKKIGGYKNMKGDCAWNNIKVFEKTDMKKCAKACDADCNCKGFSWADMRCITKSKACKKKEVWHQHHDQHHDQLRDQHHHHHRAG